MKKIVSVLLATLIIAAFAVPCFAASTTPSVTAKGAPTIVPDANGNAAVIKAGTEEIPVSAEDIKLIPVSEDDGSTDLKAALEDIQNAKSLGDLNSDLEAAVKKVDSSYDCNALVASDIFNVTVPDELAEKVNAEDGGLTMTLAAGLKPGDATPIYMIRDPETGKWDIINDVVRNDDGSVTITVPHTGTVAVLKVDGSKMEPKDDPSEKKDDDNKDEEESSFPWIWVVVGGVVVVAGVVVAVVAKKKK